MKLYPVEIEVAGPLAMFARPDSGCAPTSYPAPTVSAAKGIFESIALLADGAAWIRPTKVEICRPKNANFIEHVNYQPYTTNYGGPCRKSDLFNKGPLTSGSSMQFFGTVLSNVCYRLHGVVVGNKWRKQNNPRHHLQDLFQRRLKRGQCFRTPCLGWSEFVCSYWGAFRTDATKVNTALNLKIPSMLWTVWDKPSGGTFQPEFRQDVEIKAGVLDYRLYEPPRQWGDMEPDSREDGNAE